MRLQGQLFEEILYDDERISIPVGEKVSVFIEENPSKLTCQYYIKGISRVAAVLSTIMLLCLVCIRSVEGFPQNIVPAQGMALLFSFLLLFLIVDVVCICRCDSDYKKLMMVSMICGYASGGLLLFRKNEEYFSMELEGFCAYYGSLLGASIIFVLLVYFYLVCKKWVDKRMDWRVHALVRKNVNGHGELHKGEDKEE